MDKLEDICRELYCVLSQVNKECDRMLIEISQFETYAGAYLVGRLYLKLSIIHEWITTQTTRLGEEHANTGYVCVFLSEREGVAPIWAENKSLVEDKAFYARSGITVLSVEEGLDIIKQLENTLNVNGWLKIVDWLMRYGHSPGLDFRKLLPEV